MPLVGKVVRVISRKCPRDGEEGPSCSSSSRLLLGRKMGYADKTISQPRTRTLYGIETSCCSNNSTKLGACNIVLATAYTQQHTAYGFFPLEQLFGSRDRVAAHVGSRAGKWPVHSARGKSATSCFSPTCRKITFAAPQWRLHGWRAIAYIVSILSSFALASAMMILRL